MKKFIISLLFFLTLVSFIAHRAIASELLIEGNGEGSASDIAIFTNQQTAVDQSNAAMYNNDVTVSADTGENNVSNNTAENTTVQTGDASISETLENSGNISVYNADCCDGQLSIDIANNGTDTTNSVTYDETFNAYFLSQNTLIIQNLIDGSAITGQNEASGNMGNVSMQTGMITVNEKILNGPVNITDASGASRSGGNGATISVSGNGSGSSNHISASFDNTDSFLITNEANIANNSSWNLVTGGNYVLHNVGNIDMKTGDIVFDSVIVNGPINVSGVITVCCKDEPDPQDPDTPDGMPGGLGGLSDPGLPEGTTPSPTTVAIANMQAQGSGKSEEKNTSIASGNVLPATGGWLFLAIAFNILSLLMGVFLRLRSGRSPDYSLRAFAY